MEGERNKKEECSDAPHRRGRGRSNKGRRTEGMGPVLMREYIQSPEDGNDRQNSSEIHKESRREKGGAAPHGGGLLERKY